MDLPVMPPVRPMLAKAVNGIPAGDLAFEPKWDGFRCIVFRDGDEVVLGSRNERPLTRYFPELIEPLKAGLPPRAVVDGEIIVSIEDRLGFDALQQRIHPAESRISRLAAETPAEFVAFDVLALADADLMDEPFRDRRALLEAMAGAFDAPVHLAPSTLDRSLAQQWYERFEGAGLDGLIAKPRGGLYEPSKRTQFKVKHTRTVDVAVAGFRMHVDGEGVGSLVVGLHDDTGGLHHCGVAASFTAQRRRELLDELAPHVMDDPREHPWAEWMDPAAHAEGAVMPGTPNRWSGQRRQQPWVPLRLELVAEVKYEAMLNGRFRGTTRFVRWRPDRTPESCRFDQVEVPVAIGLSEVLAA
ncbi:MAG: ATP-dependent DNA ligase [Acidimicrobiaceae bacterium]|nr:ATP-dependent DNA ligase [Acidimicrobiaceae bacterium]MYI53398.1 ATP-dependent DNA ligase [Acidimicrobiaceae bacterium]MYJ85999.1 ATP-dependent DNA ligase [Acidimicrobiaceae bacterium]MYK73082.1 ATP-dependent DNA ligase [Acidimicrobiaceae bacterium]